MRGRGRRRRSEALDCFVARLRATTPGGWTDTVPARGSCIRGSAQYAAGGWGSGSGAAEMDPVASVILFALRCSAALSCPTYVSMKRTHHCAQLTQSDIGATVSLLGCVDTIRDQGGIIF